MITGAFVPDAGTVRAFGLDPEVDGETSPALRCGVRQAGALRPPVRARQPALLGRAVRARPRRGRRRRIHEAAARFGIEGALDEQVGGYSTGMKTRLALSRSVLHRPELLLYDEPTSGLDPESSHAVLDLIHEMTGTARPS